MIKLLLLIVGVTVLSACSSYTCKQFPHSGCQPVSAVYDRTNEGFVDYRKDLYDDTDKEGSKNAGVNPHQRGGRKVVDTHVHVGKAKRTLNYTTEGTSVLTKPVVMRILFNSWEDKNKDLNAGGLVYIRLRDSEWIIDK